MEIQERNAYAIHAMNVRWVLAADGHVGDRPEA
jgi:hypothetical protein